MMVKHWLLNLAAECPAWLGQLFPEVSCEALNVKPVPGCDSAHYARSLLELFDSAMIKLSSEVCGDDVQSRLGVEQILDRFLKLATGDPTLYHERRLRPMHERRRLPGLQVSFELTASGGEAWERMAEPDWANFFTKSSDEESCDLFSPDRHLLVAYMGWYQQMERRRIQLETVTWQTHSDFEIVYWKRLPLVHQASFLLLPARGRTGTKWYWSHETPGWFREWYISVISWHKKPWDLQGWPSGGDDHRSATANE